MKKIFAIVSLSVLIMTAPAVSRAMDGVFNVGVRAGLNFTNMSGLNDFGQKDFLKTYTGFNAGLVFNFNLPLGFELNPEILYVQSGQRYGEYRIPGMNQVVLDEPSTFRSGAIRVPINLQWGIGLFKDFIKPYLVVSPYVGAVLFGNGSILNVDFNTESVNDYLNRFQYGIGLGAGIYIWRFQLSFKWNWDLNPTFKSREYTVLGQTVELKNNNKFNGGELSLAFFF
ncbi:MAG TPA: PorT family protein [Candidatus Coprenecus stercoravium]|uniref:PorT family protein n=1 Tax=Candidatus Coprenecus stercoravium TaxID=2840735 RepID=A0A9D2KA81_9BACT|nr:PorT family protein [Candidatus Coprenecus stercoravium]